MKNPIPSLNKNTADYRPEPGSLAQRVVDLIARNREDDYATRDLVVKFNVSSHSVSAMLATPVNHGLLRFERADPDDAQKSWRAGPNLQAWLAHVQATPPAEPVPTAAPKPAAAPAAVRASGTHVRLDPFTVPIRSGVPVPALEAGRAASAPYAVLWGRLKPGDSVELTDKQCASLAAYCKKNKHSHTVRRTGVGMKAVWSND